MDLENFTESSPTSQTLVDSSAVTHDHTDRQTHQPLTASLQKGIFFHLCEGVGGKIPTLPNFYLFSS